MSKRITKAMVEAKLLESGGTWDTRSDKYIHPNDPFGSNPTWHVHPNADYPHADDVKRFDTLQELWEWLNEA